MIKAVFKAEKLIAKLKQYPATQQAVMRPILERRARALICSTGKLNSLTKVTPPFQPTGGGDSPSNAKARGEAAVARDIRRVYGGPSKLYSAIKDVDSKSAAAFWKAWKSGNMEKANSIAQTTIGQQMQAMDKSAHHAARDRRGRVRQGTRMLYVETWRDVLTYIKEKQKRVGTLASAMVKAGRAALGSISGVPAWVSRHAGPWGVAGVVKGTNGDSFVARISAPYGEVNLQRLWNHYVMPGQLRAFFTQDIPRGIQSAIKKAGLK